MAEKYNRTPIDVMMKQCENIGLEYVDCEYGSRTYVLFVCKEHRYKGVQKINREALVRWNKAGHCNCVKVHRSTTDLCLDLAGRNIEILSDYVRSAKKVKCKCLVCGNIWDATPNKLKAGRGCPQCKIANDSERLRKTQEKFCEDVYSRFPDIEIISQYISAKKPIKFRCKNCGLEQEVNNADKLIIGERGCSHCRASKGERLISTFLSRNNIQFETQKMFPQCKDERPLRFDFFLPSYQLCIEYQGEQHYRPVDFTGHNPDTKIEKYNSLCKRDEIKRLFCNNHRIDLLEISFENQNNIEQILTEKLGLSNNKTVTTVIPKQQCVGSLTTLRRDKIQSELHAII